MLKIITLMADKSPHCKTTDNFPTKDSHEVERKNFFEYHQSYHKTLKEEFTNIYLVPSSTGDNYQTDINTNFIIINNVAKSTVCTCLLASEYWEDNDELIISSSDQFLDIDCQDMIDNFRKNDIDVGLISCSSLYSKGAFVIRDKFDSIIEVTDKKGVSNEALVNFFYFSKASLFFKLATSAILKSKLTNNEIDLSVCVNEAILEGVKVLSKKIKERECFYFP